MMAFMVALQDGLDEHLCGLDFLAGVGVGVALCAGHAAFGCLLIGAQLLEVVGADAERGHFALVEAETDLAFVVGFDDEVGDDGLCAVVGGFVERASGVGVEASDGEDGAAELFGGDVELACHALGVVALEEGEGFGDDAA